MLNLREWWTRDRLAVLAALLGPLALAAGLAPFRAHFANTDAALLMVLMVVAIAANGYRAAGVLAALSAGVWFDFFLTAPYQRFTIDRRSDIETTALLLGVGIAVTELAAWGRRQHADASRLAGYFAGIQDAADVVATSSSPTMAIDHVCDQLTQILRLRRCRFDYGRGVVGGGRPRLRSDGQVAWRGGVYDVERDGLPQEQDIELLLASGPDYRGAFLLTAGPDSRPSLAQRLVAVALADRAGAFLAGHRQEERT
jgi:Domain of unknown function (DUF4118)